MAKCDFCTNYKGLLLDYKNKIICEKCYFDYIVFSDNRVGKCFECKKIKTFAPKRPELNNNKICDACYLKILNNKLNK